MKRTTILLPDDLAALVEHERRRRGVSVAEIVREAVASHLSTTPVPRRLRIASLGRSGRVDAAERAEEILTAEWGSTSFIDAHLGRPDAVPHRRSAAPAAASPDEAAGNLGAGTELTASPIPEHAPRRRRAGGR